MYWARPVCFINLQKNVLVTSYMYYEAFISARRSARIKGSQTFVSLNYRLESNKEEEGGGARAQSPPEGLSIQRLNLRKRIN